MNRMGVSVGGLVIAVIGFGLTRFTVTLAAMETTEQFLFAGIAPLVLGLSLTVFGVGLAVGHYSREFVRTVTRWCLLGTGAMALLAALTALGTGPGVLTDPEALRQQAYLSTFLIGGAVGGTLTGLYAAENRNQRTDLRQQTNRLVLLNRLLRDQVINAAMAIKGHASILEDRHTDSSVEVVGRQADNIVAVVENVKYLSGTADRSDVAVGSVDLSRCVETEFDAVRSLYPDATYTLEQPDGACEVRANTQLSEVFRHLFENAIEYSEAETPRLDVTVECSRTLATVTVSDNGPGLPDDQQALLERGEIAEFDDPTTGFGLNIVRLLVESFEGDIETTVTDDGTTIELRLPRANRMSSSESLTEIGVAGVPHSRVSLSVGIGLVAGLTMGAAMALTGFDVEVIGALYGIENTTVALITHEFHSVVFALVYATLLAVAPRRYADEFRSRLVIALAFGVSLWLVAAGVVMPLWLQLVGLDAPLPNITGPSLVGHLVWGMTTGALYHMGDRWFSERG